MSKQKITMGPAGEAVAAQVRRLRTQAQLTQGDLSKQVLDGGRRLARPAITEIETGSRRVDADDVVVLAKVLGVCPCSLLGVYCLGGHW